MGSSRTISGTIFPGTFRPRFVVAGQFPNEPHRPLFRKARDIRPHNFSALLLADEALEIAQRLPNHRARCIVCRGDRRCLSGRRLSGKFPENCFTLDANMLKIASSDAGYAPPIAPRQAAADARPGS